MALCLFFEQACVMGAQFQIGNCGEETAVMAATIDVAACSQRYGVGSCCRMGRCEVGCCRFEGYRLAGWGFGGYGLRDCCGGGRDPSPGGFDARM
jgi:hypothetical protein